MDDWLKFMFNIIYLLISFSTVPYLHQPLYRVSWPSVALFGYWYVRASVIRFLVTDMAFLKFLHVGIGKTRKTAEKKYIPYYIQPFRNEVFISNDLYFLLVEKITVYLFGTALIKGKGICLYMTIFKSDIDDLPEVLDHFYRVIVCTAFLRP